MVERYRVPGWSTFRLAPRWWTPALALAAILALAAPAAARTIGPDAFGYRATDSVPFAFEDISSTGVPTLAGTDDGTFTAPLGFTFSFYGSSFTSVSWSANGLLTFGGTNSQATNVNLSVTRTIGDRPSIAVLWDDWQLTDPRAGAVYYEVRGAPGSQRFIVQWQNAFTYDDAIDAVTFQAILFEGTNHVLLQYLDVDSGNAEAFGASATVGVRDTAGQTNGRNLVWSFNSAVIAAGQAIRIATAFDSAPPVVSIVSPLDASVVATAEVALAADVQDESETSVTSSPAGIAAALPAGGGAVSATIGLAEGENVLTVTAVDAALNTGGSSVRVVRDSRAPAITGILPPDGSIVGESPVLVAFSVSDATATLVSFGASNVSLPEGGGSPAGMVDLVDGVNSISIVATDTAGNSSTAVVRVTLDRNAPVVTIDSPADGACFGPGASTVGVVVTVNDLLETTVLSSASGISGVLPAGGGVLTGMMALTEGANEISASATDANGRTSMASITVFLDTTPPVVSIDSPAGGSAVRGSIELSASAADTSQGCGMDRVDLLVDGAIAESLDTAPFAAWIDTTALPDGPHTLGAMALDAQGSSASSSVGVVVDNTPPAAAFVEPAAGSRVAGTISFSARASDGSGSGLALLDVLAGGLPPSTAASLAYDPPVASDVMSGQEDTTRWPDGALTFTVRAVDAAGNETVSTLAVIVENVGPAMLTISPADGSVVSGVVPITVEAHGQDLEAIELHVDGVLLGTSSASPFTLSLDTTRRLDGAMTIGAVARQAGGQSSSASSVVIVDNLSFRMTPACLPLKWCGRGLVVAHVSGDSAGLLLPVEETRARLVVPGGSPVPALAGVGWGGKRRCGREHQPRAVLVFDRSRLLASIQAGIAAGAIDAGASIEIALVAEDDAIIGTTFITVNSRDES